MKKRLNKLIKKGVITETELNGFIKTLVKLSTFRVIPSKPKKVIKKLGIKKYAESRYDDKNVNSDLGHIEILDNVDVSNTNLIESKIEN
jgi:hypothetical protein